MSENKSIRRFNLDLHKLQSQISVSAFQYNTAIRLDIGITDGGIPYKIEEGTLATLIGKREEDNSNILHPCTIIENRIIYDFEPSTTDVLGVIKCNIKLSLAGQEKLTSPEFIIVVGEEAVNGDTIIDAYDNLSALDEYLGKLQEAFAAEGERETAEGVRFDNEEERKKNEIERKNNEDKRIAAEKDRAEGYAQIDAKLENKLDKITLPMRLYGTNSQKNQTGYLLDTATKSKCVVQRDSNADIIVNETPKGNSAATSKKYVDRETAYVKSLYNDMHERVSDLESLTLTYTEDSSTAYEKVAPAECGKYAMIKSIGGATKTSTVVGENKLNPYYVSFSFETDYNSSNVNAETGVIDVYLSDGGGIAEIYGLDAELEYGEYYVYIDGLDEEDSVSLSEYVSIHLHGLWDENGIPEERVVQLKIMLKKKASYDYESYYFVEAPVGTVFEPYRAEMVYEDVKVEKIESYGGNLVHIPDIVKGGISGKQINVYFDKYIFISAQTLATVSSNIWRIQLYYKDGTSQYLTDVQLQNGGSSFKATPENPIIKLEYRSTYITDGVYSGFMVNYGYSAAPYKPFTTEPIDTITIPEDVLNLDGYGREGSSVEFRDDDIYFVVTKDENLQLLDTPEETVITWMFNQDLRNTIEVEGGGRLRFVNEYDMAVPSNIAYVVRKE